MYKEEGYNSQTEEDKNYEKMMKKRGEKNEPSKVTRGWWREIKIWKNNPAAKKRNILNSALKKLNLKHEWIIKNILIDSLFFWGFFSIVR